MTGVIHRRSARAFRVGTLSAMTSPGIERKVRQLDHDVQAIYEMLAGISATQQRHGSRMNEIEDRLISVDERVDGRLSGVEGWLGHVEDRLGQLDGHVGRVDQIDGKLETVIGLLSRGQPAAPGD